VKDKQGNLIETIITSYVFLRVIVGGSLAHTDESCLDFIHRMHQPDPSTLIAKKSLIPKGLTDAIAGVNGGIAVVLVGHPLDTIKVRLQTMRIYSSAIDCTLKTIKQEGVTGLYKGMLSPLVGVMPIYSVYYFAYGASKSFLGANQYSPLTMKQLFLAGMMTGFATLPLTIPIELVKSRLQIQTDVKNHSRYNGDFDCAQQILKTEGIKGLFRGATVTFWRDVLGGGVYFALYEPAKRWLTKDENNGILVRSLPIMLAGGNTAVHKKQAGTYDFEKGLQVL